VPTSRFPQEYIPVELIQPDRGKPAIGYATRRQFVVDRFHAREVDYFWDFDDPHFLSTGQNWAGNSSGAAGTAITAGSSGSDSTERALGVCILSTGTTAAAWVALNRSTGGAYLFGWANFRLAWRVRVDTLSTGADEYSMAVGFHDDPQSGNLQATDGVYFTYNRATDGAFWSANTSANAVRTKTVTTAQPAAGVYQVLEIEVNEDASRCWFRVDGVAVASHTANIPSGAGRWCGLAWKVIKSAGLNNRDVCADWCRLRITDGDDR